MDLDMNMYMNRDKAINTRRYYVSAIDQPCRLSWRWHHLDRPRETPPILERG